MRLETSAFLVAQRFVGVREVPGAVDNPHIVAMLRLDQSWPGSDDVPWCSAFVNYVAWLLDLPRSKSLQARSWLGIGQPAQLDEAEAENDVVVLSRGPAPQGHVGFFAGYLPGFGGRPSLVRVLGGNQGDAVSFAEFTADRVLAVRRLA